MPSLARPAFPDDDGSVDPEVVTALDLYASGGQLGPVLAALGQSRVIVPIVALLGDSPADGDKGADMAAVLLTGADGRTALLAFSGVASMHRWDPAARPVPVRLSAAAEAAWAEGAAAIVLDVAGPVRVVLEADDLAHVASGEVLVRTEPGFAWARR